MSLNGYSPLFEQVGYSQRVMIDATHLKAHRTSASLFEKGRICLHMAVGQCPQRR